MANVLCIDFDDTIVLEDIAAQLLAEFAGPGWQELRAQRRSGELTLEEYSAAALALIEAEADELVAFALSVARPRAGLMELLDWAHWHGWQAAVLSNGWDIYIDPILDRMGADRVLRHCGRARRGYGWRLRYLSPRGVELVDGFKAAYVGSYRDNGDFVAYVGDGPSDVEPARLAHAVFARDALLETLQGQHPRLWQFETFDDVRAVLDAESPVWLATLAPDSTR